jgi:uncharacterized surface protein with fasciclin (FAS1) repeats
MTKAVIAASFAALTLVLGGCDKGSDAPAPASENAAAVAGDNSIAKGMNEGSKFAAAVKAAGLDATLAGPGPYTVLVPSDAAFDKLPAGALDTLMKPEGRKQLTDVLTYHILPGTMLAADIAKAIDAGKGKALVATMGGDTLTATRDGQAIVLSDSAGTKARVTAADGQRSNGVVHEIDSVLMPTR